MLLAERADLVFALVEVAVEGAETTGVPKALSEDAMMLTEIIDRAEVA